MFSHSFPKHPRYRKGKARTEQNLEPAAPGPAIDSAKPPRHNKNHNQSKQAPPLQTAPVPQLYQPSRQATSVPNQNQTQKLPQTSQVSQPTHAQAHPQQDHFPLLQMPQHTPQSLATSHPLQPIQNHITHQTSSSDSPRLIVDISPANSQRSSAAVHHSDETENIPPVPVVSLDSNPKAGHVDRANDVGITEISSLASRIKISSDARRVRPLICQDITNSNADTLRISRLPRGVTYDRILSMVEPFGEVEELSWNASDPYVCDVTYRDPAAAREAKHFLGDALVGSDTEPPLKAELRSRDPGAQLFVGDLTPDVTEEMLEASFSELVGEPVSALLKRDPDSFSPIGYGFLSFISESSANFALVAGHRSKVGSACVRVGRAERNTHLYVSDIAPNVTMDELKNLFGKFGGLVEEDTVIVRRSYAFIRYKNRGAAERAKRTLDKTDLKGRISVRYAEAEPLKACVAVQFHSSVPRPPNSLRDLLLATFSKHGNCSVEIPRLQNGMWRKVAFVTYHGEPIAANLAALEAVQSIRFVSSLPVCCQFARELIPRLPSRGMRVEKMNGAEHDTLTLPERPMSRNVLARKAAARRNEQGQESSTAQGRHVQQAFEQRGRQYGNGNGAQPGTPDFVPVYVPITALHPSQVAGGTAQASENEYGYQQQWQQRVMMANGTGASQNVHPVPSPFNTSYNSFAPLQDRVMRW